MKSVAEQQVPDVEYLGALVEEDRHLVLVPMSPDEPWAAFRQLRRIMRSQANGKRRRIDVDVFAGVSSAPADTVVSLDAYRRRRA